MTLTPLAEALVAIVELQGREIASGNAEAVRGIQAALDILNTTGEQPIAAARYLAFGGENTRQTFAALLGPRVEDEAEYCTCPSCS